MLIAIVILVGIGVLIWLATFFFNMWIDVDFGVEAATTACLGYIVFVLIVGIFLGLMWLVARDAFDFITDNFVLLSVICAGGILVLLTGTGYIFFGPKAPSQRGKTKSIEDNLSFSGWGDDVTDPMYLENGTYKIQYNFGIFGSPKVVVSLVDITSGETTEILKKSDQGSTVYVLEESGQYSLKIEAKDATFWEVELTSLTQLGAKKRKRAEDDYFEDDLGEDTTSV